MAPRPATAPRARSRSLTLRPPTRRRPPRVFEPTFSGPGAAVGAIFTSFSLAPSLLPRDAFVQGLATGVSLVVGYGLGAGGHAIWNYLGVPNLRGKWQWMVAAIVLAVIALNTGLAIWNWVGWQNTIRDLMGMDPLSPDAWPIVVGITVVVAAIVLVIARSLRLLFRTMGNRLDRWLPRRLAITLSSAGLVVLLWLVFSGLLVQGFFSASNALFSTRDNGNKPGVTQPSSPLLSGSPQSLVAWDTLGREGRAFISYVPTVEEINAYSGGGAVQPIRVYVGLRSAETLEDRADLLLEELIRTGAFDREALLLTTTTGTGFIDPLGVDPFDFIFNGDVAIAGAQYSYLPSWISLLADQAITKDTSLVMFSTVHEYWSTLPEDHRPRLFLYGLSLGSYGVESVLTSANIINEPIDGAVMVGPTFVNPLRADLIQGREGGSTPWLPLVEGGRTVRFTGNEDSLDQPAGPWGPTRVAYLQHGSDPIGFFEPSIAWREPDWLAGSDRAPDVSPETDWFPFVTMWQTLLDAPSAGSVPRGFGHLYSVSANATTWAHVIDAEGWTSADTAHLVRVLEARDDARRDWLDSIDN
ncbi:alpha/beta-hydrolase family protein [Demequina sp.]|uniref:alpha/beta hydrolase n=1 Tax=Demequina sp. TaxID=2050685 RepID=UPI0025BCB507|nr:alpha/beta-hydrolase family protein [Demequina sp.]